MDHIAKLRQPCSKLSLCCPSNCPTARPNLCVELCDVGSFGETDKERERKSGRQPREFSFLLFVGQDQNAN